MTSTNGQGHTKGPWEADTGYSLHGDARDDMMDYRCSVDMPAPFSENEYGGFEHFETQTGSIAFGRTPEEAQANARLIAAAPDYAAAAALAITALAFEQEKALRAGDQLAYAQITQAKEALIAADNKRLGREPEMRDVTPARAALSRVSGGER